MRELIVVVALLGLMGCGDPSLRELHEAQQGLADRAARTRQPILVSSRLNCGQLTRYARPVYPRDARKKRVQGIVRIRARITKNGELRDFQVIQGDALLVPAALRAVQQWRSSPCLIDGDAVEMIMAIDVPFTLTQ